MNADDVSKLARTGKHFVALGDETMLQMHALRRYFCLLPQRDYPPTLTGDADKKAAVDKEDDDDELENLLPCFDDDRLVATMFKMLSGGLVPHCAWNRDAAVETSFTAVVGGGVGSSSSSSTNGTIGSSTNGRRDVFKLPPPPGSRGMRSIAYETVVAKGHSRRSIALIKNCLLPASVHRAVIKIVSLPHITDEAITEYNSPSPKKEMSPRDRANANLRGTNKNLTPQCCFGIYAPTLKVDGDVYATNTYSSPQWVGVYWGDGKTTPQQPSMGYVSAAGQPIAQVFSDIRFCEGDTISVDVEEVDGVIKARFARNGVAFSEVVLSRHYPVLKMPLNECYLGVQLSHGAEVALLSTEIGRAL